MNKARKLLSVLLGALLAALLLATVALADDGVAWVTAGYDLQNTRYQKTESKIGVDNVGDLQARWVFETGGDVSATPAVDGETVYVPDWAGNLFAIDRQTGLPRWQVSIPAITGLPGDKARTTPALADDKLIVGTQGPFGGGGLVLAFDRATGELLWATAADTHPAAIITQSPTIFNGRVYVGVSSLEEAFAASGIIPNYPCCSFRGSMLALDLDTGAILWQTSTAPDGYSGNAVWGSSPAIDVKRQQLYIATGNNYSVPEDALQCVADAAGDPDAAAACLPDDNHFDSILALDLNTGEIRWATRAIPFDAWNVDCIPFFGDGANCPEPAGPDYDFGQAPALFTVQPGGKGKPRDLVGAGQKSGQYWALDPNTGSIVWVTQAGPGGLAGGLQWGSAVDGERVYTANANSDFKEPYPDSGVWSGLDAATGEILWQTTPTHNGSTSGPVTTANGVVYGCSLDPQGYMYALDAATGEILWEYASGGSCLSGAAISRGMIFWGSGYSNLGTGTANNQLYAFELP